MTTKSPGQSPSRADQAIRGGVTNEVPPDRKPNEAVRRRDDLTIRGADPKELEQPRQWSEHTGRATK